MKGYVNIYRDITEHWIWRDAKIFKRWMTILLLVNHAPTKFNVGDELHVCPAGSSFRSLEEWGRLFGTSKRHVKKFFDLLQNDDMISCKILGKGNRRKHLLSVVNWDKYQMTGNRKGNRKGTEKGTEKVPLTKMIENDKNDKTLNMAIQPKIQKPTIIEISEYCNERKNGIDPQKFFDYYESNGWRVGRNQMKDWRAAVRTWERNQPINNQRNNRQSNSTVRRDKFGKITPPDYYYNTKL